MLISFRFLLTMIIRKENSYDNNDDNFVYRHLDEYYLFIGDGSE